MKYIIATLVLASAAYAYTLHASACSRNVCNEYRIPDVRSHSILTDYMGNKFLRVTFSNGTLLDIAADTIQAKKL